MSEYIVDGAVPNHTVCVEDERGVESGYPHTLRPELHKALMARGIDCWVAQGITFWNRDDGCECLAYGYKANGVPKLAIKVVGFTDPEQAIDATLGRGTCHRKWSKDGYAFCSECGYNITGPWAHWRPNCGRKVVE